MKSNKEGLKSNAGVALISVLIIVTLLSLLAGTILNLSYMAYSRKLVEKKNNENFYCAEAVLDSVKSVIQNSVAAVVPKAEMSEEDFAKEAFKAITGNSLNVKVGDVVEGNQVKNIQEYLFEKVTRDDSGLKYDGNNYAEAQSTCVENALTSIEDGGNGGSFSIGKIICEEDGVRISDVQIVYVNDEGYTAKIETDILIRAPKYINVSDAPLGSYSMFAGCGAEIYTVGGSGNAKSLGNIMYLHQEGNAYFGSMSGDDSKTSLLIGSRGSNSNKGMTILSIEGTNVICNGDIQIKNGGSLIFTGGDGTETAVIRVNGYIVLNEGSNLFIAPNCKIECKGIVTALEYNSDGSVKKMVPYTGTNPTTQESAETTVSQFYPVTLDYIKSNSSWNSALNDYYDGKIDVEELFYKMGGFSGDVEKTESGNNIYLDDQYENLYSGKYNSGVYVLNETANDDGWTNRTSCKYQLMTCSYVGGEWTWKLNGKSNSQIYCNEDDENLVQDKKVLYDGTYYDAEYFDVVNVPLLNIVLNEQQSINYVFSGYSLEKKNTYSTISWGDLKDKTEYNTWTSGFDWTSLTTSYLDRDFYIPNNATTASMVSPSYDAYKFTTDVGQFSVQDVSFFPADNFQVSNRGIQFFATVKKNVTVRVTNGYSAGILLTNDRVVYGESTGVMRVISLLELGNKVTGTGVIKGLKNDGNPVHDLLEYIGSGYIVPNNENPSYKINQKPELALVDNMFKGGMAAFWNMSTVSKDNSAADNSDNDLIDVENWSKD